MRKLLVVAYYTPPLGMSGVMRVTKLCKFLPEAGWEPLVLTVKPPAYYHYDPALLDDLAGARLFRTESADPARLLNRLRPARSRLRPVAARGPGRGSGFLNHLLFPDAKAGWVRYAVRAGRRIIEQERPAAIFATAPPFSALVIGARLKAISGLPLVLDFRDPWPTGFRPPPAGRRGRLARLRQRLVRGAELALAVNQGTADAVGPGVEVLDNGFDPTDFAVEPRPLDRFAIVHVGNLWRNERELADAVAALDAVPGARLYLAGRAGPGPAETGRVSVLGAMSHREVCRLMLGAGLLLYLGKPDQPVGLKLYEYFGARRPVVVYGPDTAEAGRLVESCGCGRWAQDREGLAAALAEIAREPGRFAGGDRARFDRREQAKRLAERLELLVKERAGADAGAKPGS